MPDNVFQGGNGLVATDEVTILNGAAAPAGLQAQRVKPGFGLDGTFRDVSTEFPLPVQNATDRGRVYVAATFTGAPATTDAALGLLLNKGGTLTTNVSSIPVTAGKVLRIVSVVVGLRATVATLPFGAAALRVNPGGAASNTSTPLLYVPASGGSAVIGSTAAGNASAGEGLFDLTGAAQLAVSLLSNLTTNVAHVSVNGYEYTP